MRQEVLSFSTPDGSKVGLSRSGLWTKMIIQIFVLYCADIKPQV